MKNTFEPTNIRICPRCKSEIFIYGKVKEQHIKCSPCDIMDEVSGKVWKYFNENEKENWDKEVLRCLFDTD